LVVVVVVVAVDCVSVDKPTNRGTQVADSTKDIILFEYQFDTVANAIV